jgi:tRNA threonylcarbamoyl adenosine modification protein YeaZ
VLVMVVDSATPAVTAALVRVDGDGADSVEVLAERVTVDGRAHGELLAPQIADALATGGAKVTDLGAIVAGLGPGPFTGLRVGLVTAAAMGDALGVPTYGVCSLDAIGFSTWGRILVATDARRKEIYWAGYHDGRRVSGPGVAKPDAVATQYFDGACGDGAMRYQGVLDLPQYAGPRYPAAVSLAALAAERVLAKAPGEQLTPLYLRRPDAVAPGERKPALQ